MRIDWLDTAWGIVTVIFTSYEVAFFTICEI